MKTILCYGDSNTWGYIPGTGKRYSYEFRWTTILQRKLGDKFRVLEEGLNGRTTVWEEPYRPGRNGRLMLYPLLETHSPLNLVVLMLGTNDLKHYYSVYGADIARGVSILVDIIKKSSTGLNNESPETLLISPPQIGKLSTELELQFKDASEKSHELSAHYENVASELNCHFINAAKYVVPSIVDGVHLDEEGHEKLADIIFSSVLNIFK